MNVGPTGETSHPAAPHIFCRACSSPLVQASDWSQEETGNWRVRIWCPDCGFEHEAVLGRPEVSYLSYAIEGAFAHVLEALAEFQEVPDDCPTSLDLVMRLRSEGITSASI